MAPPAAIIAFEKAKADFEKKALAVSASGGIIIDGLILEEELCQVILLAKQAWLPSKSDELSFLRPTAELFAEFPGGQVPEDRWLANLRLLPNSSGMACTSPNVESRPPDADRVQTETRPSPSQVTQLAASRPSASSPPSVQQTARSIQPSHSQSTAPAQPNQSATVSDVEPRLQNSTFDPPRTSVMDSVVLKVEDLSPRIDELPGPAPSTGRPTTGGKSLEYLAKLGLVHSSTIKLKLKRTRKEEDEEEFIDAGGSDGEDELDEEDEEYVVNKTGRPKKKPRIVSSAFIDDSEDEMPKPKLRKPRRPTKPRERDDWPTYPSSEPCPSCVKAEALCETFDTRPKGRAGKQRIACLRCYLHKKRCEFNIQHAAATGKAEAKSVKTDEERLMDKGKGKAKKEDEEDEEGETDRKSVTMTQPKRKVNYRRLLSIEPGPSNRRRIQPEERPSDYADLCSRMNEVRSEVQKLQQATLERLSNVEQTVDRLDSNADTQKTFFSKEIAKAQMTAEIAFNQSAENRQSINAISEYSGRSAEFMNSLMDRLTNLRFDLPNALDQWATLRFGHQEGPSTVTASQLHHPPIQPSANQIPAPRLQLPIITLPEEPKPQSTNNPHPKSTQSSPDKQLTQAVWKEFILTQSSSSGEDVDMVPGGNRGYQPAVKLDDSDVDGWPDKADASKHMKTDTEAGLRDGGHIDVLMDVAHSVLETMNGRDERIADNGATNMGGIADGTANGTANGDRMAEDDQKADNEDEMPNTDQFLQADHQREANNLHNPDVMMNTDDVQKADDPMNTELVKKANDIENANSIENAEKIENSENVDNADAIENSESVDNAENIESVDKAEQATEDIQNADSQQSTFREENTDHIENAEDLEKADNQEKVDDIQNDEDFKQMSVIQEAHQSERRDSVSQPLVPVSAFNVIPPTPLTSQARSLRSSPSIIGDMTVHPPPGLLASEPAPSTSLLQPMQADTATTARLGPLTRSRSGSTTSHPPIPPTKNSKSKGRKPNSRV